MNDQQKMIEEIASFLHTYLKSGYVNVDSFSKKIHAEMDHFERLFIVRFLLHENTKQFVQSLPSLLRNFKTVTKTKEQINIAEVRGDINWPKTIRKRVNENYQDRLTFITNENRRSYDTHENIILKKLLNILYNHLYENDYIKTFYRHDWFHEWSQLRKNVYQAMKKNIYLQRVPDHIHLSQRMIQYTMNHRNPLYREAAKLLHTYERFIKKQYTEEELQQLLRETFIIPKEEDVLFELYWIIQLIKRNSSQSKLYIMDGTNNIVASWRKGAYIYSIYHDSSGPRDLSFITYINELKGSNSPYVQKIHDSFEVANAYGAKWFQLDQTRIFHHGRPDFMVVKRHAETDDITELIVGEVKNTTNINYTMTGLRELIDYMHLVKYKGQYIDESITVKGMLCLRELPYAIEQKLDDPLQIITLNTVNHMLLS